MSLPSTPLLDDFSRPDESPLTNQGRWVTVPDFPNVDSVSNRFLRSDGGDSFYYWSPQPNLTDCEAYVRVAVHDAGGYSLNLGVRISDVATPGTMDGYWVTFGGASVAIDRLTNLAPTELGSRSFQPQLNDVLVLRAVGPTITAYAVRGGAVVQLVSGSDTTYKTGYIALGLSLSTVTRLANFGGGDLNVRQVPAAHPQGGRGVVP